MSHCPPPIEESAAPEPEDFLVALVGRMIERSAPPGPPAIDYTRMLDEYARPLRDAPALPPGFVAREEFRAFVEIVLDVREALGIEAEQAWVARRYEAKPTPEVARLLGISPARVGELVLLWEYHVMAELGRRADA